VAAGITFERMLAPYWLPHRFPKLWRARSSTTVSGKHEEMFVVSW